VLIGTNTFQPDLFRQITWSSSQVFEQTLQRAKANNLSVALLDPETDVDTVEDLKTIKDKINLDLSVTHRK